MAGTSDISRALSLSMPAFRSAFMRATSALKCEMGVGDAFRLQLVLVAQGLHGPVRGMAALEVPVALVDLEIEPFLCCASS